MGRTLPSTGTWWGLLKLNIERISEWCWNNDDNHDQRISWPAEARDAELCTIKGKSKVEPMAISWQSQLWWWSSLSMYNRWLLHQGFCDTLRNIVEETRQRSKSWMVMIIVVIITEPSDGVPELHQSDRQDREIPDADLWHSCLQAKM